MDFRSFPVICISLISLQVVYSLHIEIVSQQCLFALIRNLFGDYKRTVSLLPLAHSLFLYSPFLAYFSVVDSFQRLSLKTSLLCSYMQEVIKLAVRWINFTSQGNGE